jgi:hypothetical protein
MVEDLALFQDELLFSTSMSDQCIIQWKITQEYQEWELDYNDIHPGKPDPIREVPLKDDFKHLLEDVW